MSQHPDDRQEERKAVPAKHSTARDDDQRVEPEDEDAAVDEPSKDSYPASDPPAW